MLLPTSPTRLQFIIIPNWPASFATSKINLRPFLGAHVTLNSTTEIGSEIEMFIKLPFKWTAVSDMEMYDIRGF